MPRITDERLAEILTKNAFNLSDHINLATDLRDARARIADLEKDAARLVDIAEFAESIEYDQMVIRKGIAGIGWTLTIFGEDERTEESDVHFDSLGAAIDAAMEGGKS